MVASETTPKPTPSALIALERSLWLAEQAASEPNYHRRRELEQASLAHWRLAAQLRKAVQP